MMLTSLLVPIRLIGCALALASVAACGSLGGRPIESGSIATTVTIDKAFIDMPPGGPGVVGVIERRFANSTTQEIVLSNRSHTPGQNMVTATFFGPVKSVTGPENVQANPAISLSAIGAEMRQALPGVPMRVSPYYAQSRYGSFGYAMGASAQGDTCIYAWQRIRTPDLDSNMTIGQGTITLRLRLCEPNTTEANLLAVMTGMTISSYFLANNWNPYGGAPPIPADFGKLGATVLPTAHVTPQLAPEPVPVAVQAAPARRIVRKAASEPAPEPAEEVAPEPAGRFEDYAAVPPPQL